MRVFPPSVRVATTMALLAALPAAAAEPPTITVAPTRRVVPGPNPDWYVVNRTETGRGYVDRRSIRRESGSVYYIARIVLDTPDPDGTVEILHSGEIDCAGNTDRIVALDTFSADGRLLASMANDEGEIAAGPILAGSVVYDLHRDHCG